MGHTHNLSTINGVPNKATDLVNAYKGETTIMIRDAAGKSEVADPDYSYEIANKRYVDGEIAKLNGISAVDSVTDHITLRKLGRWVFINVRDAPPGVKGEVRPGFRPIEDIDFFLTVPNYRGYPGFCNVLTNGSVEVRFSGNASSADRGFGCATYLAAE